MRKYIVTFIDKGNCEITDVDVEAFSFVSAHQIAFTIFVTSGYVESEVAMVKVELA